MDGIFPENLAALEIRYRTTATIVLGQIIFTIILTIAVLLFIPKTTETNAISQQTLTTLWAAIMFLAVGAFVLRRMFFRWDRLKDITILKGAAGLLRTLQNNAIILAVFATLLTIVGCVITVLSGEMFDVIRAEIVALIVFVINFPRKAVWSKIVTDMEKI